MEHKKTSWVTSKFFEITGIIIAILAISIGVVATISGNTLIAYSRCAEGTISCLFIRSIVFVVVVLITSYIIIFSGAFLLDKIKTGKRQPKTFHFQYKVNADALIVYDYLFERYDKIQPTVEAKGIVYRATSAKPFTSKRIQYGFVANGYKDIKSSEIGSSSHSETISELFIIAFRQTQKDVSVISLDTDIAPILNSVNFWIMKELELAFKVEHLSWR